MKLSLKAQNRPLIVIFTIALGVALWWTTRSSIDLADIDVVGDLYQTSVFVGIASIFSLLASELVPVKMKLWLVHWRIKNPTPGSRAFSEIMHDDYRINCEAIESKFGPLPTEPAEQNQKFYGIYKPLDGDISIDDAHKSYLLFRELTVVTFAYLLLGPVLASIFSESWLAVLIFSGFAIVMYCACAIAAQNSGKRFVANVLAVASTK